MDDSPSSSERAFLPFSYGASTGGGSHGTPEYTEGMAVLETHEKHQELIDEVIADVSAYNAEVDRCAWFDPHTACEKMNPAQAELIERLKVIVGH